MSNKITEWLKNNIVDSKKYKRLYFYVFLISKKANKIILGISILFNISLIIYMMINFNVGVFLFIMNTVMLLELYYKIRRDEKKRE